MQVEYPMRRRILKNGQEEHNPDLRVGDYVICIERGVCSDLIENQMYKVESTWSSGKGIKVEGIASHWASPIHMLAIKDTKLNRILYPELVPENGYMRAKK